MTILSVTSATGQLFIFYTIKEFGNAIYIINIIFIFNDNIKILRSCSIHDNNDYQTDLLVVRIMSAVFPSAEAVGLG